ncbi:MAG: hypothetical protein EOO39_38350 [Cytophagaceae bacterium]|nr:MAG: hypothetical protein EOO39_38350 [Cytophagaceae bacterium]
MAVLSWLDRENTVAGPGGSRWLFPLAVHMCIGQLVVSLPLLWVSRNDCEKHWPYLTEITAMTAGISGRFGPDEQLFC